MIPDIQVDDHQVFFDLGSGVEQQRYEGPVDQAGEAGGMAGQRHRTDGVTGAVVDRDPDGRDAAFGLLEVDGEPASWESGTG